jgi:predicted benzoate:H+ symporter BenE
MDAISSEPMLGFHFLFVLHAIGIIGLMNGVWSSLTFLIAGLMLLTAVWQGIRILLQGNEGTRQEPTILFFLSWGAFVVMLIRPVYLLMARGESFTQAISAQFSGIAVGIYLGLGVSTLLLLFRKRSPR